MSHNEPETGGVREGIASALLISVEAVVAVFRWLLSGPATPLDTTPEESGEKNQQDREFDLTARKVTSARQGWGTLFTLCAYLVSAAGAIGFLIAYWTGGSNQVLGGTLALAFGGLGCVLVLYSHWLMPRKEARDSRVVLHSNYVQRESALESFQKGKDEVHRRTFLTWILLSTSGLIAAIGISLMRSLGANPDLSLYDTVWNRGQKLVTEDDKTISIDSLRPGDSVTVFPEGSIGSERSQTVLIRVKPELLRLPKERADWAPEGYLAYSRVCTHAGCPVGIYEKTTCLLLCPCHQSTFDVLEAAQPNGGPATRPLPQLPLYVDSDGTLRAGGPFTNPPGPGFWGMP
jgi:ubiquinol-cytochrome c reductase iron-sulfur subunit